jgi:cytochrome c-type biogenesis protein CcmH/NrfG
LKVQLAGQILNDKAERKVKAAFAKADKLEPQSLAIQIGNGEVFAVFAKIEVTESSDSTVDAAMAADEAPPEASMAYREAIPHETATPAIRLLHMPSGGATAALQAPSCSSDAAVSRP